MDDAQIAHELSPETRVDEMEDGMLHTANVLVDRKPVISRLGVERTILEMRIRIAIEIPGRIDKCVHGIGLTTCPPAALRTCGVYELGHAAERRSTLQCNIHV